MRVTPLFLAPLAILLAAARVSAQAPSVAPSEAASAVPARGAPEGGPAWSGLPAFTGRVDLFTLSPRGAVDGLILADGTEVKTPPHLSRAILAAVGRGDSVTVRGLKAASLALIEAASIEDQTSGRTVVDTGPGAPPPTPGDTEGPSRTTRAARIAGRIRQVLHGARGDVNGALLEDGTIVRLPPPDALRLAAVLLPGQGLVVDGLLSTGPAGALIDASALGPSPDRMAATGPAAGAGGRR